MAMAANSISNLFSLFTSLPSPSFKPLLPHHSFSPIHKPNLIPPLLITHKSNRVNPLSAAYNVQIIVGEHDSEERILGRFKREVMKAGIIQECKRRRFFETKQEERKRRTRDAAKRNRKRRPQQRNSFQDKQPEESSKNMKMKKEEKEDDDNWEYIATPP